MLVGSSELLSSFSKYDCVPCCFYSVSFECGVFFKCLYWGSMQSTVECLYVFCCTGLAVSIWAVRECVCLAAACGGAGEAHQAALNILLVLFGLVVHVYLAVICWGAGGKLNMLLCTFPWVRIYS